MQDGGTACSVGVGQCVGLCKLLSGWCGRSACMTCCMEGSQLEDSLLSERACAAPISINIACYHAACSFMAPVQ